MNLFEGRLNRHRPPEPSVRLPRYGTLRWKDEAGAVKMCEPRAFFYSTALFYATEVFTDMGWRPVYSESGNDASMPENAAP